MEPQAVQSFMRDQKIDAWLLYDFRGSNPIFAQLVPEKKWTTRRAFLWIPAGGEPVLLVHHIDSPSFASAKVPREYYLSWGDMQQWLRQRTSGLTRVAMEYAPGATLPACSFADAGTVELVRSLGVEVVSSANLIQVCVAIWSPAALETHLVVSRKVGAIKDEGFNLIRKRVAAGERVMEHEVQQLMRDRFTAEGYEWLDGPIVAVNAHSGDPHYEPSPERPTPIQKGDWVLIDLWARPPGHENIFSDITWVGYVGSKVPPKQREVFEVVKRARDASVALATSGWKAGEKLQGWQLDDAARNTIIAAGYEKFIRHRTGHSLSPGPIVHGMGFNLDNLETHDTREMLPGLGFTIEPGIYTPEFGVRLEINLYVDAKRGPITTSVVQDDVLLLA